VQPLINQGMLRRSKLLGVSTEKMIKQYEQIFLHPLEKIRVPYNLLPVRSRQS
jgi:hypothetical protein